MSNPPYGYPAHPSAYQSNPPAYHPQAQYPQQGGVTTVGVDVRGTMYFRQSPNDPIHNYHESNPPSQSQHGWTTNSPLPESGFSASQRMPQDQEYRVQRLSPHLALPYRPSRFLQHDWDIDFGESAVDFKKAVKRVGTELGLHQRAWDLIDISIQPDPARWSIGLRESGQAINFLEKMTKDAYHTLTLTQLMHLLCDMLTTAWTRRTNRRVGDTEYSLISSEQSRTSSVETVLDRDPTAPRRPGPREKEILAFEDTATLPSIRLLSTSFPATSPPPECGHRPPCRYLAPPLPGHPLRATRPRSVVVDELGVDCPSLRHSAVATPHSSAYSACAMLPLLGPSRGQYRLPCPQSDATRGVRLSWRPARCKDEITRQAEAVGQAQELGSRAPLQHGRSFPNPILCISRTSSPVRLDRGGFSWTIPPSPPSGFAINSRTPVPHRSPYRIIAPPRSSSPPPVVAGRRVHADRILRALPPHLDFQSTAAHQIPAARCIISSHPPRSSFPSPFVTGRRETAGRTSRAPADPIPEYACRAAVLSVVYTVHHAARPHLPPPPLDVGSGFLLVHITVLLDCRSIANAPRPTAESRLSSHVLRCVCPPPRGARGQSSPINYPARRLASLAHRSPSCGLSLRSGLSPSGALPPATPPRAAHRCHHILRSRRIPRARLHAASAATFSLGICVVPDSAPACASFLAPVAHLRWPSSAYLARFLVLKCRMEAETARAPRGSYESQRRLSVFRHISVGAASGIQEHQYPARGAVGSRYASIFFPPPIA
ncbi:hypothetical protein DFH06DRAFT_1363891 [Mycena polygramma]|nr:hypothetical protein DFH06DRAFT_1363891 [Mycena polygramma]